MKKIIKNILIFISYFIFSYFVIALLQEFNFDITKFSFNKRIIILGIIDFIYIILMFFIYRKEIIIDIKDFKKNYKEYLSKYVLVYMVGVILMGIINILLTQITKIELSGNEEGIRILIKEVPIYMFFSTVIYAPIIEELIFRKSIRNIFKNKYIFIIISGVIFGVLHISDFSNINEILFGIPYIIMGIDFAYIYYKTNNIFTTMSFHMIHNLLLITIQFIK